MDCHIADAPRNDDTVAGAPCHEQAVIARPKAAAIHEVWGHGLPRR
jgi:hypothetical protein